MIILLPSVLEASIALLLEHVHAPQSAVSPMGAAAAQVSLSQTLPLPQASPPAASRDEGSIPIIDTSIIYCTLSWHLSWRRINALLAPGFQNRAW